MCLFFSVTSYAAPELIATEFDYRQIRWLTKDRATHQIIDGEAIRSSTTGFNETFDQSFSNAYGNATQNSFMRIGAPNAGPVYLYGSGSADAIAGAMGTYTTVESMFMGSLESQETFTGVLSGVLRASYFNTIGIDLVAASVKLWEGPAYAGGTVIWSRDAAAETQNEVLNFSHTHTFEPNVMYVLEVTANARANNNLPGEDPNNAYQYGSWEFTFETDVTEVDIDVLPGDAANRIYPNKGGKFPVAILSGPVFDATQVDSSTIKFGLGEASPAGAPIITDVDGQSGPDTTLKFWTNDTGIFCNDTEVTLTGETYAGEPFAGTDAIDASDCVDGGCHPY